MASMFRSLARSGCGSHALRILVLVIAVMWKSPAYGQIDGHIGLEGRVFDRATGRPVQDAVVAFNQRIGEIGGSTSYIVTDSEGFYQFDVRPLEGAIPSMLVTCETPKGNPESTAPLYSFLRPETTYRRDFYLAMPRRQTRCRFGPSGN